MKQNAVQNFFVGNDAHWDDIYAENEKAEFYRDSETDFVVCNYTPERSSEGECEFVATFPEKFKKFGRTGSSATEF